MFTTRATRGIGLALTCTTLLVACGDADAVPADVDSGNEPTPLAPEQWQLVFEGLDGALMSVGGTAENDVWTVGGDTRDGDGALVLHFDGDRWSRVPTGAEVDLWWVHPVSEGVVFVGGAEGTILRWDGDRFDAMETPGSATVYGIWGTAADDLWAVGGDPDVTPGFVWHFDGTSWEDRTDALPQDAKGPALFKVWGRAADDVWMVGAEGVAVHWTGGAFEVGDSGTSRTLFTVHGAPTGGPDFVAVGGFGTAAIVENDGTGWHEVTPIRSPPQMFGVFMDGPQSGCAVGFDGAVMRRDRQAWKLLDIGLELFNPFHAVWVDPTGGIWAVGGEVLSPIPTEGMLVHAGSEVPDAITE